jgi:class 3 adenylate cyclase
MTCESNPKVLVVDDNFDSATLLERRVRRLGCTVCTAADGRMALDILADEPIDLMLLDMMMPGMGGVEVLERMGELGLISRVPVLVISADDNMDTVTRCLQLGADDYLTKPFRPAILEARVRASLRRKQIHAQEVEYLARIARERERASELLRTILPGRIADELEREGRVEPRKHESVAVFFADVVGFSQYCLDKDPPQVLAQLQELMEALETVVAKHGGEKIKTIGDAFMGAVGLFNSKEDTVARAVACALEMLEAVRGISAPWALRIGVHCGPVVAGIVGHRRYTYDIWGETVNTASRVEKLGEPNCVNISAACYEEVRERYPNANFRNVQGKAGETFKIAILAPCSTDSMPSETVPPALRSSIAVHGVRR